MSLDLDPRIPDGPIDEKWQTWLDHHRLVGPRQRGDHKIIVVGTGLAGSSAAATLAGQGYKVDAFCFQDSARRAHSIAAQGGINATKDYANEGDSVQRLFVDTVKGGDFRAREANVWRLAELSTNIIDQAVAQGVPFNREYGGMLATRSFGGVLVERTFYCRGQTGQQLLLGAYSNLQRQVAEGQAKIHNRHELLDIVVIDGQARGIIARNLVTGEIERHSADAVVLATRRLLQRLLPLDQRDGLQRDRRLARPPPRRGVRQPLLHADPPDLDPGHGPLPVEADPDERVAAKRRPRLGPAQGGRRARGRPTFPRTSATTSSRSATRGSATWSPATSPRARRRSSATTASASAQPAAPSTSTSATRSSSVAAR